MRWENLYVAGTGAHLPEKTETAAQAVAEGRYDAGECEGNGIRGVRVAAEGETGPVMAARAGAQAVARSGHAPEDFGIVVHAGLGHQGQDFWTPAHFVQHATIGGTAPAYEVRQGSNGGLAAIELAASHLAGRPADRAALVTTGDAFVLPYVDRWTSEDQTVYGDGAAAVVLSSTGGFAKVRSTASAADGSLEPLYRGMAGWTAAPFPDGRPVDLRSRKREYLARDEAGYDEALAAINKGFGATLQQALDDAGTDLASTQWFVHANLAQTLIEWGFYGALGVKPETTAYEWGKDIGHVGGGDQLLGLNHLLEAGKPKAGDLVVAVGSGIGFQWTVMVLEMVETPAY